SVLEAAPGGRQPGDGAADPGDRPRRWPWRGAPVPVPDRGLLPVRARRRAPRLARLAVAGAGAAGLVVGGGPAYPHLLRDDPGPGVPARRTRGGVRHRRAGPGTPGSAAGPGPRRAAVRLAPGQFRRPARAVAAAPGAAGADRARPRPEPHVDPDLRLAGPGPGRRGDRRRPAWPGDRAGDPARAAGRRPGRAAGGPGAWPRGDRGRAVPGPSGAAAADALAPGHRPARAGAAVLRPVPRRQPLRPAFRALPRSAGRSATGPRRPRRMAARTRGRLRRAAGTPCPRRGLQLVQLLRLLERP